MESWGYVILIAGAIVIGLLAQYALRRRFGYAWIATAIGAGVGGFVASEYALGGLGKWGTAYYGLHLFPALIGGVIVAAIVEAVIAFAVQPPARAQS